MIRSSSRRECRAALERALGDVEAAGWAEQHALLRKASAGLRAARVHVTAAGADSESAMLALSASLAGEMERAQTEWTAAMQREQATRGELEASHAAERAALLADMEAARALLAEIYLQQGEYGGAANTFATLSGQAPLGKQVGDSRYPSVGGTLAQGLLGVEVYDVEGFAENWRTLAPAEQAALRAAVAAARQRGAMEKTALPLVAIVEAGVATQSIAQPESRP